MKNMGLCLCMNKPIKKATFTIEKPTRREDVKLDIEKFQACILKMKGTFRSMLTKKKGWQKWEVCLRERESVWVFFYVGVEKATWQAKINGKKRINHIKGIERGGKSDNTKHIENVHI